MDAIYKVELYNSEEGIYVTFKDFAEGHKWSVVLYVRWNSGSEVYAPEWVLQLVRFRVLRVFVKEFINKYRH